MEENKINNLFSSGRNFSDIVEFINNTENKFLHIKGILGSACSIYATNSYIKTKNIFLIILNDKEEAAYFHNDIVSFLNEKEVMFLPSSYKRSVQYDEPINSNILQRTEILNKLRTSSAKGIIVTYPEALIEKTISVKDLKSITLTINKNEEVSIDFIYEVLEEYKFERADFVYEPGQYSIRGSIIDIFSFTNELPYRIDFFGDEIESIRTFNIETQLSEKQFNKIRIAPNINNNVSTNKLVSLFEFIPKKTVVWINDYDFVEGTIKTLFNKVSSTDSMKKELIIDNKTFGEKILKFKIIEFGNSFHFSGGKEITFNISYQPHFNKSFELLLQNVSENHINGYANFIVSENKKQIERLQTIFYDINKDIQITYFNVNLHKGFIDHDLKICCYTDHQIFDRYHRFRLKENRSTKAAIALKELNSLKPGDYVVHIDHGIGMFGGLEHIENNGKQQEAIRLVYKNKDILYVNIHSLHKISKYKGKDSVPPKIYKLGSGAWSKLKNSTKKKIKDIAKDLIALYAKRKEQKGFAFSADSYLNNELEASFIYEDTPDQIKANQAVKKNMESNVPMDHLICGDVGFGKTEIAIRAAFKAVADSTQVAILVPTTILAFQHFNTFTQRLKNFPATIDYLNRFKKPKEQKETIKNLQNGKVDIIIGTHRLISKDIKFKELGLLIIDEEQKFGVAAKEKLKQLKANVDTLTLTATPIPRTLQFSLMGARDLSIINTPPPNRQPIITEIHRFSEELIREAIDYEVSRNGQVFFVNNRVQNIQEVVNLIKRICPKVNVVEAHGQMDGKELENRMFNFINGNYDVLVATTIIESGLDIPNSNTIIINNAQNFGLSDLHQLRGRVGRSNKQAFCYLLTPPLHLLPDDARRRLTAIENYSELGSGFNIALQDLDIRGAGNLLGGEQSGFITDIGFETYHKILNEAMLELHENEFKGLFSDDEKENTESENIFTTDCHIDTDFEIFFPDYYIQNISERIKLYRVLDNLEEEDDLNKFENELTDRFGNMPKEAKDLFYIVRLRSAAKKLGIEKIIIKNSQMYIYFITNQESKFYNTETFSNIIKKIQQFGDKARLQEKKDRLGVTFQDIKTIETAIEILNRLK